MFDTICSLPLTSDLFAQSLHPTKPIVAVGLSSGHVQSFKLPAAAGAAEDDDENEVEDDNSTSDDAVKRSSNGNHNRRKGRRLSSSAASENGLGEIETAWRTRRHKGSCRCLAYSPDGEVLYSAGTDGLVKGARSEDGQVVGKIAIPQIDGSDGPSLLHILTPQTLLLATDSSALYIYDIRDSRPTSSSSKPKQTHHPHDDYASSITPLSPSESSTSGLPKQFLTTGGTTVAITDLRKGVISRSEDQEDELISSVLISGLKAGGVWDDQDARITVDGLGESVESLVRAPEGVGGLAHQGNQKLIAVGLSDGRVRFVRLGPNQVVQEMDVRHDDLGGVSTLGFDVAGRMVSGGGPVVKVWRETRELMSAMQNGKVSSSDDGSGEESGDSDAGEKQKSKRKKRKRGKGKDRSGGQHVMALDLE